MTEEERPITQVMKQYGAVSTPVTWKAWVPSEGAKHQKQESSAAGYLGSFFIHKKLETHIVDRNLPSFKYSQPFYSVWGQQQIKAHKYMSELNQWLSTSTFFHKP